MSRPIRIVLWVLLFAGAAAGGAVVAAHTNPFPPGVEDPGAVGTESPSPTAQVARWTGTGSATTKHRLYVGGSCTTTWRFSMALRVSGREIAGAATARLRNRKCDFSEIQVQAQRVIFDVAGSVEGSNFRLNFSERTRRPSGSIDLGALVHTLPHFAITLRVEDGKAAVVASTSRPDGDRGRRIAQYRFQLRCMGDC